MLEHFWSGDASFLINMSDKDYRRIGFLRKFKDGGGTFPYLNQTTWRGVDGFRADCLYGVNNDDVWLCVLDVNIDLFQ